MADAIPFRVEVLGDRVILQGVLDGSKQAYLALNRALTSLSAAPAKKVEIDADTVSVVKDGLRTWVSVAHDCLWQHELTYKPSQLAMALMYFDGYRHQRSHFTDG